MIIDNHDTVQLVIPGLFNGPAARSSAGVITFLSAFARTGTVKGTVDGEAAHLRIKPIEGHGKASPFCQAIVE